MAESEVRIPHVKFTCGPEEEEEEDESAPMLTTTQPVEDQGGGGGTGSGPEQADGVDVPAKLTYPSPQVPVPHLSGYPVVPPCMIRATGRTPVCLQGPRHLFTVVPVASAGTLEKLDEECTTEEGGDGGGEGGAGEGTPLLSTPQEPRVVVTPPPPVVFPSSSASATGPDRSPRLFNSLSRLVPPPPAACSSARSPTSSLHTIPSAPVLMGTAPTVGAMRGYYHRMSPHDPYHTVTALPHSHVIKGVGGAGGSGGGSGIPSPLQTSPYQTVTGSGPLQGIPPSLATIVLPPSQQVRQKGLPTSRSFCSRPRAPHLQYRGVNRVIPGGMTVGVNSEGVGITSSRVGGPGGNVAAATAAAANVCPVDWPYGVTIPALHQLTAHSGITSPDQLTVRSLNQLTIRSGGSVTVDVGSTDGRNIKVRGAVVTPEQLFVPYVRHGLVDDDSDDDMDGSGRQTWQNKAQFVLACTGYAVGLGNIWRFPYLCYKSGGGAFMIPYLIMLFLCGIPLLLMEMTVGQYTRRGPIGAMEKMCPFFKGAGVGTVVISFLLGTYYNVIIAWTIFYLFKSFSSSLPWKNCNASWATDCFDGFGSNVTAPNGTNSPTQEFFNKVVLEMSDGIEEQGVIRWQLVLALLGAWLLVYFSLWKSVKSSGKVVYVTATLPYLLIGAFLWRALTLPGASTGLRYLFSPRWGDLLKAEVWVNAAAQNFNSIGIAFGSLIAFSSYNKFNNNILIDTWIVSLTNSLTSLLAGLIVFATLGNIAEEQGKDVEDVVAEGPGLVFVVYPQAIAKMPFATLWAILFFFMLLILGLDSQFATVEVIITSLTDGFPKQIKKYLKRHEVLVLLVCAVSLIFGLPNVTQGGIYFFQLIDYYAAAVSLMYLAFFEVVAIVWAYGAGRLARNLREMTGRYPSYYFLFCWYFAAPALILAIWIFSMVDYKRPTYNDGEYNYPDWAIGLGWVIASFSIAPIPIFAAVAVIKAKGSTFWEKLRASFRSQIEECPCCGKALNCLNEAHQLSQESLDKQDRLGSIELATVPDNSKPNGVDLTTKENWNVNGFANGGEKVVLANSAAS